MLLKLNKIPVKPLAVVVSILHAIVGVVLGVIITLGALLNQESEGLWGLGAWAILVLPILNAILGYCTGTLIAMCYNMIFSMLGKGIELEFEHLDAITLK